MEILVCKMFFFVLPNVADACLCRISRSLLHFFLNRSSIAWILERMKCFEYLKYPRAGRVISVNQHITSALPLKITSHYCIVKLVTEGDKVGWATILEKHIPQDLSFHCVKYLEVD